MSYYGTVAKICQKPIEKELASYTGIRACCESSKGEIIAECGEAINEEGEREMPCQLCNSHPDDHPNIPFNVFMDNPVTPFTNTFTSDRTKFLYGMPDCLTQTFNFSDYDWTIYPTGDLKIGSGINNHTNYCINYGQKLEQGD